jgi:hypothetical protein
MEAKRKAFMDEVKSAGLSALSADQKRRENRTVGLPRETQRMGLARSTLLNNGINPSTGLIFTEAEMVLMEKKANTPERLRQFQRIKAGRAGLLNEQPPLGGADDYLEGMTVGEFREKMDDFYTGMGLNL